MSQQSEKIVFLAQKLRQIQEKALLLQQK